MTEYSSEKQSVTTPLTLQLKIHGMDCAEEITVLKRELGPVVGGEERLSFDLLNGKLTVQLVDATITLETLISAIARTGMRAEPWQPESLATNQASAGQRINRTALTITSGLLGLAGFLVHAWQIGSLRLAFTVEEGAATIPFAAKVLYSLGILAGVWYVLPKAWFSLVRLRPDMNLLMTIAVLGAIAIGEWFEAVTVAFLFAVSLALESWSVERARRAVATLLNLTPPTARLKNAGESEQMVSLEQVSVGTHFVVLPGERIPLDGRVVLGTSDVNQAPITGESVPVPKTSGEEVFAGTINGDGALEVKSTKAASDTTLAHIVRLVGEAQAGRAPSEQWVEKFARIYTPAVLLLAIIVLFVPPLIGAGSWNTWFYNALVLLVIACPCALVISTPVSIVAALAAAARQGVLIKGGEYVEAPARLKAIALDKTGTLTEGKPVVMEVIPLNGHTDREVLERAAAMESRSNHPIARAILAYTAARGIRPEPIEDFQTVQGKGATAQFNGKLFWIGSHRYLEERKQETPDVHQQLEEMSAKGRTVVVIGNETHVCGLIALADQIRPQAKQAVQQLRQLGVEHLVMLTGDNEPTARAIAKEAGIAEYRAELLPGDKVTAIDELVSKYGQVAMIGDGINDAPALARASMGIAMGAFGSDAAIETADIALMSDDLTRLPWLIAHSRRTLTIIRQNIYFSLGIKLLFVLLTISGHSSLWAAIAADMGASMIVIFNGLRLLR